MCDVIDHPVDCKQCILFIDYLLQSLNDQHPPLIKWSVVSSLPHQVTVNPLAQCPPNSLFLTLFTGSLDQSLAILVACEPSGKYPTAHQLAV